MNAPDRLYAGDTLEFSTSVPDYPPSDGWALVYDMILPVRTPNT